MNYYRDVIFFQQAQCLFTKPHLALLLKNNSIGPLNQYLATFSIFTPVLSFQFISTKQRMAICEKQWRLWSQRQPKYNTVGCSEKNIAYVVYFIQIWVQLRQRASQRKRETEIKAEEKHTMDFSIWGLFICDCVAKQAHPASPLKSNGKHWIEAIRNIIPI